MFFTSDIPICSVVLVYLLTKHGAYGRWKMMEVFEPQTFSPSPIFDVFNMIPW